MPCDGSKSDDSLWVIAVAGGLVCCGGNKQCRHLINGDWDQLALETESYFVGFRHAYAEDMIPSPMRGHPHRHRILVEQSKSPRWSPSFRPASNIHGHFISRNRSVEMSCSPKTDTLKLFEILFTLK